MSWHLIRLTIWAKILISFVEYCVYLFQILEKSNSKLNGDQGSGNLEWGSGSGDRGWGSGIKHFRGSRGSLFNISGLKPRTFEIAKLKFGWIPHTKSCWCQDGPRVAVNNLAKAWLLRISIPYRAFWIWLLPRLAGWAESVPVTDRLGPDRAAVCGSESSTLAPSANRGVIISDYIFWALLYVLKLY